MNNTRLLGQGKTMMTTGKLVATIILAVAYLILFVNPVEAGGLSEEANQTIRLFDSPIVESSQRAPLLELTPSRALYRSSSLRKDFESFGRASQDDEFAAGNDALSDDVFLDDMDSDGSHGPHKLSTFKAVALSTLLPGAGQWYIGKKREARLFLGAEAGIWAGFAALKVYAGWKQDDVERFATRHAGVNGIGQDEQFFRQLTFYSSREEYNSLGRAFDPDLPFIPDTPENDWNWDSQASRVTFRQLFNDQNSADRNADFMFIAAIVNRLTSAALAWRSTKKRNNTLEDEGGLDEFGVSTSRKSRAALESRTTIRLIQPAPGTNGSDGLMLALTRSF